MMRIKTFLLLTALTTIGFGQTPVQLNPVPSRAVGQATLQRLTAAPNLVEGRELNAPIGVAVDATQSTPILYVTDTGNNRVLVWRNAKASNGSKADLVIGQNDFFTTVPLGPGTTNSVGMRSPTGIAVDSRGNLYVVDAGNNRILRYARVTEQQADLIQPNLVIGQTSFSAREPNQGNTSPTARTLAFTSGSTLYTSSLGFDANGNLWVSDPVNSRVLRYPAAALGDSATNAPEADLVIGQSNFTSLQTVDWGRSESRLLKSAILQPMGVAFDPAGRLLVTDTANRLMVYAPPFQTGMSAARYAGLVVSVQGQPALPAINQYTLRAPNAVFATASGVFVMDSATHRILRFDPVDQWPDETQALPSPAAKSVFGQPDFNSFRGNRGLSQPSEGSLLQPTGVAAVDNEVYLTDSGNNRLLVLQLNGANLGSATRVQGQLGFSYRGVNLVDARGMFVANGAVSLPNSGGNVLPGGAVVMDRTSNPPRLYIADTYNNRILGYSDARLVKPGDAADLIIGQTNEYEARVNSPTADVDQLTDQGLQQPSGIAVDSKGDLYVADAGNGRVLRFPRPFDQAQRTAQRANLVIGQTGFNIKITDPTQRNMSRPYGVALTVEGHLLVSDLAHNRVLLFRKATSGDFSNGQPASVVFGQRDFLTASGGNTQSQFNGPMHIATDTDDRLYVCDAGNRRVAIFDRALAAPNFAAPAIVLTTFTADLNSGRQEALGPVQGINVSPRTGEIWVSDAGNNRVVRYPRFDRLVSSPASDYLLSSYQPMAVSIDLFDNLLVVEGANRVAFHYPGLAAISAAHFLNRRISPGMVAALYPLGIRYGDDTVVASAYPLPTDLSDVQVLVDETPAPLYFVSPGQINFYVPMRLEPGGRTTVIVQRKSTNQILASGVLDIGTATPALFTTTQNGRGQVAALNEDNSINTNTNGVARGQVIQLFATGQGKVPGAPADGEPPSGAISTPRKPRVIIGSTEVSQEAIEYSGLAPGLVGVWQINVRVPMAVPPSSATQVVVLADGIPSNQPETGGVILTTIAVK